MKRLSPFAIAFALAAGACSEIAAPVDTGNLTPSETSALAFGVSALALTETEAMVWEGSSSLNLSSDVSPSLHRGGNGGPGRPGFSDILGPGFRGQRGFGRPGTSTVTTEWERRCPQGGSLKRVTQVTTKVDTVAHTGEVATKSTDTPAACAFTVDSLNVVLTTIANPNTVITITGTPSLVTETLSTYTWEEGQTVRRVFKGRAATTGSQVGSFSYTTSDGRSGECRVDLEMSYDPEAHEHSITGTFCGHRVDISRTLPARRPHR